MRATSLGSPTLPAGRDVQQQIEGTDSGSMALSESMRWRWVKAIWRWVWLQRTALAEGAFVIGQSQLRRGMYQRTRVVERAERRIGITAVIGADTQLRKDVAQEVSESLVSAFEGLGAVDWQIVLSNKAIQDMEGIQTEGQIPTVVVDGGWKNTWTGGDVERWRATTCFG